MLTRMTRTWWLGLPYAFVLLVPGDLAIGQVAAPDIPLIPGLTFVLAAHNAEPAAEQSATTRRNIASGDYDVVVSVTGVTPSGIEETTGIDAVGENRQPLQLTIHRHVLSSDLANSRLQILGFHTDDPHEIPGSTSLGPSVAVARDLRTTGRAEYSVMNFLKQSTSVGTLTRVGTATVPFSVLINGRRVTLQAMPVTGLLKYGDKVRPWEQLIYDDPKHPLTLRFAYGAVGAGAGFTPEFTRDIVKIDFPVADDRTIETALTTDCRAEVPGIYFDFDRATLKPQSSRALTTIAQLLERQPSWRVSIEGHTDNSGSDTYNQDLSTRRADAVRTALVHDFAVDQSRLTSAGFGERRPVETNDTIAGRARNRRVELVRNCEAKR